MSNSKPPPHPKRSSPSSTPSATAPLSPSPSPSASSSANKSQCKSRSCSANNANGYRQLDCRLRSVLSHPLGLPLVSAFHGQDPGKLDYLRQQSQYFSPSDSNDKKNAYADVLRSAVAKWTTGKRELKLTTALVKAIHGNSEFPLNAIGEAPLEDEKNSKGLVDILFHKGNESKPLMLVEVGLSGVDWWKKFDQGLKYIKMAGIKSKQPLLLAIMTIDDERRIKEPNPRFVVKLGVFLCFWKNEDETNDDVRISLLWQSKTRNLDDGSKAFGRLLRGVCDFSSWREKLAGKQNELEYEYLSSNCCRVGIMESSKVLRSFDSRFRESTRSPEIYLSPTCVDIVGEGVEVILNLPSEDESLGDDDSNEFWNTSSNRLLQVIVIPYRSGRHDATKPTSFIPVISKLKKLHEKGLVHGDIRGFNTVFDEENEEGYLIDFDFGGKPGREYPDGYKPLLADGYRRIDNKTNPSKNIILPWHDWYALGRLIFLVHKFVKPNGKVYLCELDDAWASLCQAPTNEMISDLKRFLIEIQRAGCTVKPGELYQAVLDRVGLSRTQRNEATNPCATGSPPEKKH